MSDITYKLEERRQKLHLHTYAVLCLLLLASLGSFAYSKWPQYQMAKEGVIQNKAYIVSLGNEVSNEKAQADNVKAQSTILNKDIAQKLKIIFPTTDDYTNLTKQMDAYEVQLSTKSNPFEVSNIDFQTPIPGDNYSILPMRMNIRSSNENFTKFMKMVESSGALNSDVRLMDMSSIRLNFENNDQADTTSNIINFSVQINAFFQK